MNANTKTVAFSIEALTVGGAEQMLVAMANQFAADGWQVHMLCLTKAGELAEQLDASVTLHILDKKPGVDTTLPKKIRKLIELIEPDAINSHLWTANLWMRVALYRTQYKVFATEHSRDFWKSWYHRLLDRVLTPTTHKLIAVSHDTAQFYRSDVGIADALVTVINNGVDTQRYAAGDGTLLRQEWVTNGEILLGTVGRLVSAKNHVRLIEMAVELKSRDVAFKLVIAGDGEERAAIEAKINQQDLSQQVLLLGQRLDIPDLLHSLDIFILSSDREGHPLTALEAQAAGTPVILTNAGGSADAIAGGRGQMGEMLGGMLVEKSPRALADAVVALQQSELSLARRGKQAQAYALAHFDKRQMIDAYQRLFLT